MAEPSKENTQMEFPLMIKIFSFGREKTYTHIIYTPNGTKWVLYSYGIHQEILTLIGYRYMTECDDGVIR